MALSNTSFDRKAPETEPGWTGSKTEFDKQEDFKVLIIVGPVVASLLGVLISFGRAGW